MVVHLHVGGRLQGNYDEMAPAERVLSVEKTIALFLETRRTFRGVSGRFECKCDALLREMIVLDENSGQWRLGPTVESD